MGRLIYLATTRLDFDFHCEFHFYIHNNAKGRVVDRGEMSVEICGRDL